MSDAMRNALLTLLAISALYDNAARFLRLSPEEIARHHEDRPVGEPSSTS